MLMKFFLLFLLISFWGVVISDDSAVQEVSKLENATENLLNSNAINGLKKLSEVADVCAASGNVYSAVIAAGLNFGVAQLDEDKAAAFEALQKNILGKVDTVEQCIQKLERMLPWELFKIDYSTTISRPLSRFMMSYNTSLAYEDRQKGVDYLKARCIQYNPLGVLQDLEQNTQCSAFSADHYIKISNFVDSIERKINFANVSSFAISIYDTEKQKFILSLLRHNKSEHLLKKLQLAFNQLTTIDFNRFMEHMISTNENGLQLCWSDIVYVGVDHSRTKFEKFIQVVELDAVRALNYVTICADIVHNGDRGAVSSEFKTAWEFIDKLTKHIQKYYDASMEKAYPEIFKLYVKEAVGNSVIEKSAFNKTAQNLKQKLNRRGLEKYDYHVIITDLITNDIESAFQCRKDLNCFDLVHNNLRIFVIRYVSGIVVTTKLLDNEAYWIDNEELFKSKILEPPIADELLPYTDKQLNVFFRDEVLAHFSVLILHNKKWELKKTDLFYGYDFSRYQGEEMMKSVDRYDWLLYADDHVFKIMFFY